ncbi:MAG TPA: hypothetical protein VL992_10735 [Tepidisphaeraceae bacterium]|nr:hypothetical protein [Tepidisphaeraceae bacterium]
MISAQATISRFRRDLTIGAVVRGLLFLAVLGSLTLGPVLGPEFNGALVLVAIGLLWMVLGYRSLKGSRLAADSPVLIASGRFDEAETRIHAALRSFSVFKAGKLLSLHQLAVLRHAQRRWQESALLSRALLGQRLGALRGLSKPSMLLLADDLLHMGDLAGAHESISRLYQHRLSLAEALALQELQLEYLARIGAWDQMLGQTKSRVQLAELMPPTHAARTQALLALAARKTGRENLAQWLARRANLVGDARAIVAERPFLAELWPELKLGSI